MVCCFFFLSLSNSKITRTVTHHLLVTDRSRPSSISRYRPTSVTWTGTFFAIFPQNHEIKKQTIAAENTCAEFLFLQPCTGMCTGVRADIPEFPRNKSRPGSKRILDDTTLKRARADSRLASFWRNPARAHSNRLSNPYQKTMFSGIIPAVD